MWTKSVHVYWKEKKCKIHTDFFFVSFLCFRLLCSPLWHPAWLVFSQQANICHQRTNTCHHQTNTCQLFILDQLKSPNQSTVHKSKSESSKSRYQFHNHTKLKRLFSVTSQYHRWVIWYIQFKCNNSKTKFNTFEKIVNEFFAICHFKFHFADEFTSFFPQPYDVPKVVEKIQYRDVKVPQVLLQKMLYHVRNSWGEMRQFFL